MTVFKQPLHFNTFIHTLQKHPQTQHVLKKLHTKDTQTTLILFLIWYSLSNYGRINKHDIQTLRDASESWHNDVVKALSHLANTIDVNKIDDQIRHDANQLSDFALEAELEMLEKTLTLKTKNKRSLQQQITDSCHNIAKYISIAKTTYNNALEQKILQILSVSFYTEQPTQLRQPLQDALHAAKVLTHTENAQLSLQNM